MLVLILHVNDLGEYAPLDIFDADCANKGKQYFVQLDLSL